MTIKEVERKLDIPRATVRFYEKEGLLVPSREENGYRDYSPEDVDRIKEIIILRKIGLSLNDIEDLFDGAKTLPTVLEENISNLETKMEELKGALNLSMRLKEDSAGMESFDINNYWNIVGEEEKKGNRFFDVAKDIARTEKGVIFSYLGWTDKNGELYNPKKSILYTVLTLLIAGAIYCLCLKSWDFSTFLTPVKYLLEVLILEVVLSVPLYFLGKKHPWIKNHRYQALIISDLILAVIVLLILIIIT